ncbi:MAG: Gfo/Idh/MocA family oxidoreductase [Clostridia bacterium]|nr:Gfo/Idh/MocA family oxidoreductase [Clostridia bacterium]MBQ8893194.1 Gfo/Idh/MocA family oxidoreductase [Clostridia bacterium]
MNEKRVKFGAIGASNMGLLHIEAIARSPKMELMAVCDKDPARLEIARERVLCPSFYTDWRDVLKNPEVEAVVLCVPDGLHLEMTEAALAAGKDVLCEKPMALTLEECEAMRAAEKKYGGRLMIGQICRYTPAFIKTKELIQRGEIGELFYVESEYAHDYSIARGADDWRVDPRREPYIGGGCHAVDLLRWIAGDPYEITAYSNHKCLTDWPVNDCTVSILRFPGDVLGKVFVSIGCKRNYTMRSVFYGTKGTIICDNTGTHITVFKEGLKEKDPLFTGKRDYTIPVQYPVSISNHNTFGELENFAESILQDAPVPTTSFDGECTVAVCVAAAESARLGKAIEIQYPKEEL